MLTWQSESSYLDTEGTAFQWVFIQTKCTDAFHFSSTQYWLQVKEQRITIKNKQIFKNTSNSITISTLTVQPDGTLSQGKIQNGTEVMLCLQCFDTVGWVAGSESSSL